MRTGHASVSVHCTMCKGSIENIFDVTYIIFQSVLVSAACRTCVLSCCALYWIAYHISCRVSHSDHPPKMKTTKNEGKNLKKSISLSRSSYQGIQMTSVATLGQSGWCSGVLPCFPPLGPGSNPNEGTMWNGFFSLYLTAWGFPGIILWDFPPPSKTEHSSLSSLLIWL